jgi:uncharacterized protein YkwD
MDRIDVPTESQRHLMSLLDTHRTTRQAAGPGHAARPTPDHATPAQATPAQATPPQATPPQTTPRHAAHAAH